MKLARVKDSTFVRDVNNNAVLQTDMTIVRRHEVRMKELQKEQIREQELNTLKQDVQEIKNLLKQLLQIRT
jgi:hypothetical protein